MVLALIILLTETTELKLCSHNTDKIWPVGASSETPRSRNVATDDDDDNNGKYN